MNFAKMIRRLQIIVYSSKVELDTAEKAQRDDNSTVLDKEDGWMQGFVENYVKYRAKTSTSIGQGDNFNYLNQIKVVRTSLKESPVAGLKDLLIFTDALIREYSSYGDPLAKRNKSINGTLTLARVLHFHVHSLLKAEKTPDDLTDINNTLELIEKALLYQELSSRLLERKF